MSISFPSSPSVDDTYAYLDQTWLWNGTAWIKSSATETGNTEGNTGEIAYYGVKGSVIKGATGFKYNDTTHGISAHGQSTFVQDLIVNEMTVGKGGGGTAGGASLNTAFGKQCLENLDGGLNNTAVGYQSLAGVTIGVNNTAVGAAALKQNLNNQNTAFGYRSLYDNRDGSQNTSVGAQSLISNTKGEDNTAIGFKALFNNANNPTKASEYGTQNTSLGSSAGGNIIYGENNTCLGFNAQTSSPTVSNEIVLGDSNVTLIHSAAGLSLDGGATFGDTITISSATDANLHLMADTNDFGESDIPLILLSSDGGNHQANIGLAGPAGSYFTGSLSDAMFFEGMGGKDIQFANNELARYTIHSGGINHFHSGISADAGATFGGVVGITGSSNFLRFPDGTTLGSTQTETIGISVSNGSQVLTTGKKGQRHLPYNCEVTDWTVTSTDTGSIAWDINWCTYANWPTTALIDMHTTEVPKLESANKNTSPGSIPNGKWNTRYFNAGDIIEFEIDSVSTLTNCTLTLTIVRQG